MTHKLLRTGVLITCTIVIICIISGCADGGLTGNGDINLVATVPENEGIISATGDLKIFFDSSPTSVTVNGKPAIIQDNTAIVKIADLPSVSAGTENAVTIEWRNLDNSVAGTKTTSFTVIKRATTVVVDHAVGSVVASNTEFTLTFNEEVLAAWLNGTPARGSGLNWKWSAYPGLPTDSVSLKIEWINRDGSKGLIIIGPYRVIDGHPEPPIIIAGTVFNGEVDVDPVPINADGFRFTFNIEVTGTIKLTDKGGTELNWQANVSGTTATLTPVARQELTYGAIYKIEIDVQDLHGEQLREAIFFLTKPK